MNRRYTIPNNDLRITRIGGQVAIDTARESVVVNGNTLTAHEIIMALKQLTTKPVPKFRAGDIVRFDDGRYDADQYVVVNGTDVEKALRREYSNTILPQEHVVLVSLRQGHCNSTTADRLALISRGSNY